LQGSPEVESTEGVNRSGLLEKHYEYPDTSTRPMPWNFRFAAFLSAIWLYLVFLLVIASAIATTSGRPVR